MATMDIFEGDAFSIIELTRALENIPYKPALLSGSGLYGSRGVRTRTVVIESRDGTLSLIPFSERGGPYDAQVPERRQVRAFVCRQFKKHDMLWASEIQAVRDFGSEFATQQVQAEVARKLGRLRTDAEATFEYHLLNGLQGVVKDPKDGAVVIDYFTEFAIAPAAEIDFDLDNATPGLGRAPQALPGADRERRGEPRGPDHRGGAAARRMRLGLLRRSRRAQGGARDLSQHRRGGRPARPGGGRAVFGGITFRRYRGGAGFGCRPTRRYSTPRASMASSRSTTPRPTPSRPSTPSASRSMPA